MSASGTQTKLTNPFPGLRPFREEEEYLFFGRESQVDAMVNKLATTRFLAVVGTSGSGKSSLVNCGLRPALHGGLMAPAGTDWRMAQFRPGSDPLAAMASALAADGVLFRDFQAGGLPLAEIVDTTLRMSTLGLVDMYEQAQLREDTNLLVVVDQFEELFRYRQLGTSGQEDGFGVGEEATAFVNLLLEAAAQAIHPIYVVLTMRSDFLGDCAQFAGLAEAINAGQYLVPRMTRDERRAAISGPVAVGGAAMSPVLLTRLVNDVGDNPDQLSILQHALNRTWARWEDGGVQGPIELSQYEAIGTMAHALDQHAEKAYAELESERQRTICEKLFAALTDKATDPRGIRRPTTLGTLCALTDATEEEVTGVIEVFRQSSRSFLMPPAGTELRADTVIDISHETLLRVWQRLNTWADEEAEAVVEYLRLADSAQRWINGKAELLPGRELERAEDWRQARNPTAAWAERYDPGFSETIGYLAKSRQAAEEKIRRARNALRIRNALVAATCLILAGITIWALLEQRKAVDAERKAVAAQDKAVVAKGEAVDALEGLRRKEKERRMEEIKKHLTAMSHAEAHLAPQEIDALWKLAAIDAENREDRGLFLDEALGSEENAQRLENRMAVLAHALVGMNDENRKALLPIALKSLNGEGDFYANLAAAQLYPYFISEGDDESESVAAVIDAIVAAILQEPNAERRSKLSQALGRLRTRLPERVADKVAGEFIKAMRDDATSSRDVAWLGYGLAGMGRHLPETAANDGAHAIIGKIEKETDHDIVRRLAEALEGLSRRLSETAVARVASDLVEEMKKKEEDSPQLSRLGEALGGLGVRLPAKAASDGADVLLSKIVHEKDSVRLYWLATGLGSVGERLSEMESARVAKRLVEVMQEVKEGESNRLSQLGTALGNLGSRSPKSEAKIGAEILVAAMAKEEKLEPLLDLAVALEKISKHLSETAAVAIANQLLSAIRATDDPRRRCYLCIPLSRLGKGLTGNSATEAATILVGAVREEKKSGYSNKNRLYLLAKALRGVGENGLKEEDAAEVANSLQEAIGQSEGLDMHLLRWALGGLGSRLRGHQARAAVEAILAVNLTHDPNDEYDLGDHELVEVLETVTQRLGAQELVDILKGPLCVGEARVAILKVLGEKTGGVFHEPHDLELRSAHDESSLPKKGKSLVIVAKIDDRLHFRVFDGHGNLAVNWGEESRAGAAAHPELAALKGELQKFWSGTKIPKAEESEILQSVTSFLGHSLEHDIWNLVQQAEEHGLNTKTLPQRPPHPSKTATGESAEKK